MVAELPSLITQEINLGSRAAQTGEALHELLLDYGFRVVEVREGIAVYQSQPDGYQVTLDAVGPWWIKPQGDREFPGVGFADLEAVLSPDGRVP